MKMGCWGLVIYAATGAICSGRPTSRQSSCTPSGALSGGKQGPGRPAWKVGLTWNRLWLRARSMEARVSGFGHPQTTGRLSSVLVPSLGAPQREAPARDGLGGMGDSRNRARGLGEGSFVLSQEYRGRLGLQTSWRRGLSLQVWFHP